MTFGQEEIKESPQSPFEKGAQTGKTLLKTLELINDFENFWDDSIGIDYHFLRSIFIDVDLKFRRANLPEEQTDFAAAGLILGIKSRKKPQEPEYALGDIEPVRNYQLSINFYRLGKQIRRNLDRNKRAISSLNNPEAKNNVLNSIQNIYKRRLFSNLISSASFLLNLKDNKPDNKTIKGFEGGLVAYLKEAQRK